MCVSYTGHFAFSIMSFNSKKMYIIVILKLYITSLLMTWSNPKFKFFTLLTKSSNRISRIYTFEYFEYRHFIFDDRREKELPFIQLPFALQTPTVAQTGHSEAKRLNLHLGLPCGCQGLKYLSLSAPSDGLLWQ